MSKQVLIVGGTGRIGSAVARDLHQHTNASLTLTGRDVVRGHAVAAEFGARGRFLHLDLDHTGAHMLRTTVSTYDLVILCAGPFRTSPPSLLLACVTAGVDYVDICDDKLATRLRLGLHQAAHSNNVTALIDVGTFPGIDNVLVAAALARLPHADTVHLRFVCAGSGDGGLGVLQTTFLAVSRAYTQLIDGQWEVTPSFRGREVVEFAAPLGRRAVYNFEVPELWSLPHVFPQLRTCTSKFGVIPGLWNRAIQALTRIPEPHRRDEAILSELAGHALPLVHGLDRWVGTELGIRVDVSAPNGEQRGVTFYAPSTGRAVGWSTGIAAAMVLDGEITTPGVLLPETHIPSDAYIARLGSRGGQVRWD